MRPEQVSIGKLNNTREAIEVARTSRGILGANGITLEYPIMRHMTNLESVITYEGTEEVHTLVIGVAHGPPRVRVTATHGPEEPLPGAVGAVRVGDTVRKEAGRGRRRYRRCCATSPKRASISPRAPRPRPARA